MIITKKTLPRRTFLRGVGATLALPMLDAMTPVLSGISARGGRAGAPARVGLPPERHGDGVVDPAGADRAGALAHAEPARRVP